MTQQLSEPQSWSVGYITRGMISRYAAAVGESNPIYYDSVAARAAGFADVIAPPGFLPAILGPDDGVKAEYLLVDGLDQRRLPKELAGLRIMGGGQELTLHKPLSPGVTVTAERRVLGVEEKQTRKGLLRVLTSQTVYSDDDGEAIVTCTEQMLAV